MQLVCMTLVVFIFLLRTAGCDGFGLRFYWSLVLEFFGQQYQMHNKYFRLTSYVCRFLILNLEAGIMVNLNRQSDDVGQDLLDLLYWVCYSGFRRSYSSAPFERLFLSPTDWSWQLDPVIRLGSSWSLWLASRKGVLRHSACWHIQLAGPWQCTWPST